ncbi:MAG: isoaspartyl peptidase/L-asparaginase [Candidatus Marinimicrobia bacterium]|nr:isoaspartyl peptidase/L-asparaginase [Candidatus Neomarinimicrobiota bacterium]
MKSIRYILGGIAFTFVAFLAITQSVDAKPKEKFALVIHGGAGTITRKNMTTEKEAAYRAKLEEALQTGYKILNEDGTAMDAVEATIHIMEDSPLFNAGKGAVFTNAGTNELDAAIMNGADLKAGAVAGVKTVKNPISAARKVMEETWHVLLAGKGADKFAEEQGLEIVDPKYFHTERRWKAIQKMKANEQEKYGTVGCVALDKDGNIAAGTSTGGMTNKRWGRVGDVPIIGAGTYANNKTCAVSATGTGEYFIRAAVAHDISALMEYKRYSLKKSSQKAIDKVGKLGGSGGVIAIDAKGNIAMPFNTKGMYRGYIKSDGNPVTLIYKDE